MEKLKEKGGKAFGICADLKDISRMDKLFDEVLGKFGRIDVLFSNASVARRQPLWEVTPEDYDYLMDINLRGTFSVRSSAPGS